MPLSTQEQGFHEAIAEAPLDPTPRLVYADWLEEKGRNLRATLLRREARAGEIMGHENMISHMHVERLTQEYHLKHLLLLNSILEHGEGTVLRYGKQCVLFPSPLWTKTQWHCEKPKFFHRELNDFSRFRNEGIQPENEWVLLQRQGVSWDEAKHRANDIDVIGGMILFQAIAKKKLFEPDGVYAQTGGYSAGGTTGIGWQENTIETCIRTPQTYAVKHPFLESDNGK